MYRVLLPLLSLLLVSCQTTNPAATFPDMAPLVAQMAQTREALQTAGEQFQATREQVTQLATCEGGDLQTMHAATITEHDNAVQAAVAMGSAIDTLEQTANTLFQQWQIETAVLTDTRLKAANEAKMTQTWQSYQELLQLMQQSDTQADTVLAALNTTVVSLQDNLNASTVAARQGELEAVANDIGALVQQINSTIVHSDAFSASLPQ